MGGSLAIPQCGECDALFSYETSMLRFPDGIVDQNNNNNIPISDDTIDMVCGTLALDTWFKNTIDDIRLPGGQHYGKFGERTIEYFFGGHDGLFRMYPARHSPVCGEYDNRRRPWYVSGSAGPRDIIVVLDTSGSMNSQDRMEAAREAARSTVHALTIGDHFTVVAFSSQARRPDFASQGLVRATKENIDRAKEWISNLKVRSSEERSGELRRRDYGDIDARNFYM